MTRPFSIWSSRGDFGGRSDFQYHQIKHRRQERIGQGGERRCEAGTAECTGDDLPLPKRRLRVVVDETLADHPEDGFKPIWVFDNHLTGNSILIATFPPPADRDYRALGGHFRPHNIHENRPGSLVSEDLIFATYQNAGLRPFDIRKVFRPEDVGGFVPPPPA